MRVWDDDGNFIVDTTTRVGRIVESVDVTTSAPSSINVPLLTEGEPFAFYVTPGVGGVPDTTIMGTLVSWSFPVTFTAGTLIVGVY